MTTPYIFLSYSHKDTTTIQPALDWLERNYHVWYDRNLGAAREYNEEIADQIRNAAIVVAFFSESYMESPYCRDEIMYARAKGVEILGIVIGEVEMSEGMKLRLGRFQMIEHGSEEEYTKIAENELVRGCRKDENGVDHTLLGNLHQLNEQKQRKQLPRMLFATDFEGQNSFSANGEWKENKNGMLRVPIGLRQDLDTDEIAEAYYDAAYGHQYIYGNTMGGKSTLMQTILLQLMEHYSPDAVQFYLIDYGNYMMEVFHQSPHVGDVMGQDDPEKIKRFFLFIEKEREERIRFFKNGSYSAYAQKYGVKKPMILVAIDGFETFCEKCLEDEVNQEAFKNLLRDGMRAGILLLLGKGSLWNRVYAFRIENVRTLAALGYEKADKYDEAFEEFMSFSDQRKKRMQRENFELPGKGMIKAGKKLCVFQAALPLDVAEDYDRYDAVLEHCQTMGCLWQGKKAKKVPSIPASFTFKTFLSMLEAADCLKGRRNLPIGLNIYTAEPVFVPLGETYVYPIVGHDSSGKSNFLRFFMRMAGAKGFKGMVFDSQRRHRTLAEEMDMYHVSVYEEMMESCRVLMKVVKDRQNLKLNREKEPITGAFSGEAEPFLIFIDNLTDFYKMLHMEEDNKNSISKFYYQLLENGMNYGIHFVVGLEADKRVSEYVEPIAGMTKLFQGKWRQGIYFGEKIVDEPWFNVDYLQAKDVNYDIGHKHGKGTGLVVRRSGVEKEGLVRIPLAE